MRCARTRNFSLVQVLSAFLIIFAVGENTRAEAAASQELWSLPAQRGEMPLHILPDTDRPGLIYAAMKDGGLVILKESESGAEDRTGIRIAARVLPKDLGGLPVTALARRGDMLYAALGDFFRAQGAPAGLAAIDIGKRTSPQVVSLWKSEKQRGATCICIDNGYLYLGMMSHGIGIFDIAAGKPRYLGSFLPDTNFPRKNPGRIAHPNVRDIAIHGNRMYVAYDAGGLRVADITRPDAPVEMEKYLNAAMKGRPQAYNGIALDFNNDSGLAYLTVDYAGLEVVDLGGTQGGIRQIAWLNPWRAGTRGNNWFNSSGHTNQIRLDRQARKLFISAGDSELMVVDVSDPGSPKITGDSVGTPRDGLGVWSVARAPGSARVYLGYINAVVPFRGKWNGIKAFPVER